MSRTDKDMPAWVTAEWYKPFHYCGWVRRRKYHDVEEKLFGSIPVQRRVWTGKYYWEYLGDCDLPEEPTIVNNALAWRRKKNPKNRCVWEMEWPRERYYQSRGAPHKRFWRHANFYDPQRMKVRLAAREVIKGNHEVEFPDGRGRHSILWDLW